MQLLIISHLVAAKRKASTVELTDIQRAYTLFLDQARSVEFLERNEREFISGKEWEEDGQPLHDLVSDGVSDGAFPMQEVQA